MGKSFDPAKDIPDLRGKVVLVTGGNAGIGKATIRALAQHDPAQIYLCARRRAAAETTAAELAKQSGYRNIAILDLDLASLESVKVCASQFNAREDRLDLLFLNAGVGSVPPATTKEGYEFQFGVNHVGHALLTQLLMPKMLQTMQKHPKADVRIIATSSNAAFAPFLPKGGLALDEMRKPDPFSPLSLYAHSKLANVHFVRKLAQEYPRISVTAVHPGFVMSDIWQKSVGGFVSLLFRQIARVIAVDIDEGARPQLWCGAAPRGTNGVQSGQFYEPVGKLKMLKGVGADQKLTDELWTWTNSELSSHGGTGWPTA